MTPPPEAGAIPQKQTQNNTVAQQRRLGYSEASHTEGFGADYFIFRFMPRHNLLRRICARIVTHRYFDRLIILVILMNSVTLGMSDFSVVDTQLNPISRGKKFVNGVLVDAYSPYNKIIEVSELPFTITFATECVLKVIAMGISGPNSYYHDSWNILDFLVVLTSVIEVFLPHNMSNVSAFRTIRVLRPLRSLSVIPGMRLLISALLKALPALGNVVILQIFVFFIFGILGIQLLGGSMNHTCRLTEFPVRLPLNDTANNTVWPVPNDYLQQVLSDPESYKCLDAELFDLEIYTGPVTKETSPWHTPQNCFWPTDDNDQLLCAGPGQPGNHRCPSGTTCGADFDTFGNPRFQNTRVVNYALYNANLNWGLTSFDHIGDAFFTIFQCITQEGWTLIMYMAMDASQPTIGAMFFIVLIIFASFFVMNLTLAVITEEFNLDETPRGAALIEEENEEKGEKGASAEAKDLRPWRHWLTAIVSHKFFTGFITAAIVANTVVLACDHYGMSDQMASDLEIANFGLSCIFVVEMLMKLAGLGLRQYARDKFNLFDAFIVTTGLLETIANPPSLMSSNPPKKGAVSALRAFRLFRVFRVLKLSRGLKSLRELLEMIARAVAGIANFGVLLFLFIYIYALIGMQFFGNTMRYDNLGYPTVYTLDEFWNGTVITGENWNNIMYDTIRGNGKLASIYFISLVIMGDFVLMNLFLALLLDNFGADDEDQIKEKEEDTRRLAQKMSVMTMKVTPISEIERSASRSSLLAVSAAFPMGARRQSILEMENEDDDGDEEDVKVVNMETFADELTPSVPLPSPLYREPLQLAYPPIETGNGFAGLDSTGTNRRGSIRETFEEKRRSFVDDSRRSIMSVLGEVDESQAAETTPEPVDTDGRRKSLFLFSKSSTIRQWACFLATHPLFDSTVFVLIVISSIALAIDNPLTDPNSALPIFLKKLDKGLTALFTIEMMVKIVAMGLILNKGSYLRNNWNIMDGFIVLSSLITLATEVLASGGTGPTKLISFRSFRAFRMLRPLRMISRRPGLKLVVNALFEAVPEVLNVLFISMLFYLIFSIVAVNYLKGGFNNCVGDAFNALSNDQGNFLVSPSSWDSLSDIQQSWFVNTTCEGFPTSSLTSKYICECWGGNWDPVVPENFDHVGVAMLTFFEISTGEGWSEVMVAAIDSNGIDMQPIQNNNTYWAYFFILFMMVGSFFVVNLFVGVIIDNFNRMKAALGGDFMLTPEQKKWIEAQKAASRVGPVRIIKPPKHPFRRFLFYAVKTKPFEWFIMICIIINTFLMATQYFGESTLQANIISYVNDVFAGVFTLEAGMKLAGFGWGYFQDQWNQFDFFVVLGTLVSVVVEQFTTASLQSLAMLVRIFRVTRILRLVKASKSIRQILMTLYIALPGLSNITSILFLLLFIYSTMGVQLFAKVAHSDNIDSHANFQNFGNGFLLLVRTATGEAWDYCMHDLAAPLTGGAWCDPDPQYNVSMCGFHDFDGCIPLNGCGNMAAAYLFFCSFTLLVTYVMLNLTIAVILEGFSQSHEDEEPLFDQELLEEFQVKWADIDPKASGFVHVDLMVQLVNMLKPPLGRFGMPFNMQYFFKYMCELEIPLYEGEQVRFRDVLLAMTREMVKGLTGNVGTITQMPSDHNSAGVEAKRRIPFLAHQYFGARRIQRQVSEWLRIKRKLEKQYMEEYKNKIKKPSGRPKKQRDARVYSIG